MNDKQITRAQARKVQPFFWLAILCVAASMLLSACVQTALLQRSTSSPPPVAVQTSSPASVTATKLAEPPASTPGVTAMPATRQRTETASLPVIQKAASATPTPVPTPIPGVTFAVIGDYGGGGSPEGDVAALVQSWQPDFIVTTGDNNYPSGSAATIDENIGRFYHAYIQDYQGSYGEGATTGRFFPTLGNHDWNTQAAQPYLDYFSLPGNERYYDFVWGPVHFFALDSDSREPDGVSSTSIQAEWLKAGLAASTSAWNIVYFHHPPYSSGLHGSTDWMRWPFKEWGASAVLAGHDHTYERLEIDGLPYFIDGLGGASRYYFTEIVPGSAFRYAEGYGALRVTADGHNLYFEFIGTAGATIDQYLLQK